MPPPSPLTSVPATPAGLAVRATVSWRAFDLGYGEQGRARVSVRFPLSGRAGAVEDPGGSHSWLRTVRRVVPRPRRRRALLRRRSCHPAARRLPETAGGEPAQVREPARGLLPTTPHPHRSPVVSGQW